MRGDEQEFCGSIHPLQMSFAKLGGRKCGGQINLGGDANALSRNIEERYRADGATARAKAFGVFFPSGSQRRNNSRAGDDDARRLCRMAKWE
jgi:hypothetical protein